MSKKPAKSDAPNFETLLAEVEGKLTELEGGELSLEDSLAAYEAGVKALRQCHAILKAAEGRIEIITNATDAANHKSVPPETADYDAESGTAKKRAKKPKPDDTPPAEPSDDGTALF
jgi:exodeoxyribonuclease VII small subunit